MANAEILFLNNKAMEDAVNGLSVKPEHIFIDGNDNIPFEYPSVNFQGVGIVIQ